MARYVILLNWTEQGARNYKETVNRAASAAAVFEKKGGKLVETLWTLGSYDLVLTAEAPDDETVTAIALQLAALGNVKTTTLRAFNADEMRKVIAKAGS